MGGFNTLILGIFSGIAAAMIVALIWLGFSNAHLRAELAAAATHVTACQTANDGFRQQADQQSHAVARLQQEAALREKQAAEAMEAARTKAAAYISDAARLARATSAGEDCKAAADLFNSYIAGLQ